MKTLELRRDYLWFELAIAFGGLPLLIYSFRERGIMFALLWLGALLGFSALKQHNPDFRYRVEWNAAGAKAGLRSVWHRFCMLAILLFTFTVVHDFNRLFSFPLERPSMWLLVMLLYPLLSVWPQEMVYRSFFLTRYAPILGARIVPASALAFGYAHIVFNNWIAIVFCIAGGWLFATTYQRHRSLALVCIEHALYGCLIFTLGLGWYFYGAAWRH
jgi:hypothetical protein